MRPRRSSYELNGRLTFPSSPPPLAASNSFYPPISTVDQFHSSPQLHRLQPPPAPRLPPVPLPNLPPTYTHAPAPLTAGDVFPIDLADEIDFQVLARGISDFSIPPHTIVYVLPASRACSLLQIETKDRPSRAFSVIRRLQSILREPLSLHVYRTQLQPVVQESVRRYFLSQSGRNGAHLWQGFLNGLQHRDGPRGLVLLQGHSDMWGFSQDHGGQWVIHVEMPLVSGF
ncbi:hypothetical protein MSAN_01227500 [Mycena sanguinolenta]|uniref:Uncharacterized protein n=1 Tax=Mycena sanguinolenta TaxID=230812 RepID=A0A8H7D4V9_9AGAR|nr:hypothetical protein MSAN_01227500 [Mycena sanguinolenta]